MRKIAETAPDFEGFPVSMHGFAGNGVWRDSYERIIPGNFNQDEDHENVDLFTRNVMKNYAHEGVIEGKPSGQFFITKD